MNTLWTILIVTACILAIVTWIMGIVARLRSRSSTPPSPTPSTTPTPTSDDLALKMMEAMNAAWAKQMEETRQMVADLTLGRESQQTIGTQEILLTRNERPLDFDYDSIPLSPGIEAVLEREEEETEQHRILREREELQNRLIETQAELDRLALETSSEAGPWTNGDNPAHARRD